MTHARAPFEKPLKAPCGFFPPPGEPGKATNTRDTGWHIDALTHVYKRYLAILGYKIPTSSLPDKFPTENQQVQRVSLKKHLQPNKCALFCCTGGRGAFSD